MIDDGYKTMAKKFYDGTATAPCRGSVGRCRRLPYRDAFEEFANARVVLYLSGAGSRAHEKQIVKNFDWVVVPNPCGAGGCTGMPGGAAFVALKRTKNPKDVGRFLDFMAGDAVYAEYMAKTNNIPASAAVAKKGVDYNVAPAAKAALDAFVAQVGSISPVAYEIQGYQYNRASQPHGTTSVKPFRRDESHDSVSASRRTSPSMCRAVK